MSLLLDNVRYVFGEKDLGRGVTWLQLDVDRLHVRYYNIIETEVNSSKFDGSYIEARMRCSTVKHICLI